ncbi:MAG: hypothetical protein ABI747_04400 [Candidatus Moraniibacteriota bacterium]
MRRNLFEKTVLTHLKEGQDVRWHSVNQSKLSALGRAAEEGKINSEDATEALGGMFPLAGKHVMKDLQKDLERNW